MTTVRANILSLAFFVIAVVTAAYLYPSLPDQLPSHFITDGKSKTWSVPARLLSVILVFVIMKLIPALSPKGYRTENFTNVLNIFTVAFVGFLSGITVLILLMLSGRNVHHTEMVYAAIGLLFIVMGNYLGKVRKNFFLGIRTPWTLVSDEVWNRTHRFGGRVFVLIGFFLFLNAFIRPSEWSPLIGSIVVVSLVPVVYSYVLYRKIEGFAPDDAADT